MYDRCLFSELALKCKVATYNFGSVYIKVGCKVVTFPRACYTDAYSLTLSSSVKMAVSLESRIS